MRQVDTESRDYGALTSDLFSEVKRRFVTIADGQATVNAPHRSVQRTE